MKNALHKNITKNLKQEQKLLNKTSSPSKFKAKIYQVVPQKLTSTLQKAFFKAFCKMFIDGSAIIEKTFDKGDIQLEHDALNYVITKKASSKMLKRLDKPIKKVHFANSTVTTLSGVGMGFAGWGIPDIPVFVGVVLNGIYRTSASYGYDYTTTTERVYILRLIATALATDEERKTANQKLEQEIPENCTQAVLEQEMQITAKAMADALLVEKFVQGIPLVGMVGGFTNCITYKKISNLAVIKYKKRYLQYKATQQSTLL